MNDYERERLKNIEDNKRLLASLGVDDASSEYSKSAPSRNTKKRVRAAMTDEEREAAKKRRKEKAAQDEPVPLPTRRSNRAAGLEPDGLTVKEEAVEEKVREEAEKAVKRVATKTIEEIAISPEDIATLNAKLHSVTLTTSHARPTPTTSAATTDTSPSKRKKQSIKKEELDVKAEPTEDSNLDLSTLQNELANLVIRSHTKVLLDRVFSMTVHPDPSQTLVFAASKGGDLAVWDPESDEGVEQKVNSSIKKAIKKEEDEGDEDEEIKALPSIKTGKLWRLNKYHGDSISAIRIAPQNGHKMFTSSYDSTIRSMDLTSGQSATVFEGRDLDDILTHLDLSLNGQEMWISDKGGAITHVDLREKARARRYVLQEKGKKFGAVSINPLDSNIILTASNDTQLRIWDVRSLSSIPKSSSDLGSKSKTDNHKQTEVEFDADTMVDWREKNEDIFLDSGSHGASCSAAYWSPNGQQVVSTSYDDKLRIWDYNLSTKKLGSSAKSASLPTTTIKHDTQTGRWVTILRAQWCQNLNFYPHFSVGNMGHSIDVFGQKGEVVAQLYDPNVITSVQAVTAQHPNHPSKILGGSASGKIAYWAKF